MGRKRYDRRVEDLTELGRVGRLVSSIGLGMAALGRPGYLNLGHGADLDGQQEPAALEAHTHRMLDEAWRSGITYFDAARSYGRAEAFLSSWISDRGFAEDAHRPTVATKWGYAYVADWRVDAEVHETKDLSIDQLDRQHQESLDMLDPFLDVLQIHSATEESEVLDNYAVTERLRQIRADGMSIGLTTTGPGQATTIRKATELTVDGDPLFDVIQSTWNLLEPSAGPALAEAHEAGMAVVVKEAMANGRLAGRDQPVADRLRTLTPGVEFDQLAMAAALAQPWSTVTLSGATTPEQLHSNLEAESEIIQIQARALAASGQLAEEPEDYWRHRSDLAWT